MAHELKFALSFYNEHSKHEYRHKLNAYNQTNKTNH